MPLTRSITGWFYWPWASPDSSSHGKSMLLMGVVKVIVTKHSKILVAKGSLMIVAIVHEYYKTEWFSHI